MKKEKNLGRVGITLREGEEVEIIVANVKILDFERYFQGREISQNSRVFRDDM